MIPFKATAYFSANISSLFDRIAYIDSDMDVKVMFHETIFSATQRSNIVASLF